MQALDAPSRPCDDPRLASRRTQPAALPWLAQWLLRGGPALAFYERVVRAQAGRPFFRAVLSELDVTYTSDAQTLARIPARGPLVVVANHPFGILEGAVLADLVSRVRDDVRVLTNHLLCSVPELLDFCIPINPFGGPQARRDNQRGLGEALGWLEGGGALIVFPAGEVSHPRWRSRCIADPPWHHTASRLIQKTGAQALPVHVSGYNSTPFYALGLVHPRLRTVRLPAELLNKRGRHVDLQVGQAQIATSEALRTDTPALTAFLRARTYALGQRCPVLEPRRVGAGGAAAGAAGGAGADVHAGAAAVFGGAPMVEAAPADKVAEELMALPPGQRLHEDGEFMVFVTRATHIPYTMRELGRAREMAFRAVGEGTGRGLDLDGYDAYYEHLILWHKGDRCLAGAYRLADMQSIRKRHAAAALYTQTLFDYSPTFFDTLGPALELGRSFVVAAYQRHYGALLALWKAVARYVALHPRTPVLMGAVSISRDYSPVSRDLMVRYLLRHVIRSDLASQVQPRMPFVPARVRGWNPEAHSFGLRDVDALSVAISDIEADGKGLPVLLRKYLKLRGRVVAFNLDRQFSDALDALVVVDLRETDPRLLSRFMAPADLDAFTAYHAGA